MAMLLAFGNNLRCKTEVILLRVGDSNTLAAAIAMEERPDSQENQK